MRNHNIRAGRASTNGQPKLRILNSFHGHMGTYSKYVNLWWRNCRQQPQKLRVVVSFKELLLLLTGILTKLRCPPQLICPIAVENKFTFGHIGKLVCIFLLTNITLVTEDKDLLFPCVESCSDVDEEEEHSSTSTTAAQSSAHHSSCL